MWFRFDRTKFAALLSQGCCVPRANCVWLTSCSNSYYKMSILPCWMTLLSLHRSCTTACSCNPCRIIVSPALYSHVFGHTCSRGGVGAPFCWVMLPCRWQTILKSRKSSHVVSLPEVPRQAWVNTLLFGSSESRTNQCTYESNVILNTFDYYPSDRFAYLVFFAPRAITPLSTPPLEGLLRRRLKTKRWTFTTRPISVQQLTQQVEVSIHPLYSCFLYVLSSNT